MAILQTADNTRYYAIQQFLGLNESQDSDTQLKLGEASYMENWRITEKHHLRIRPGLKTMWQFTGPIRGMWNGVLNKEYQTIAAADGKLWKLLPDGETEEIGTLTDDKTFFFEFSNKVYILNGHEYMSYDGVNPASDVDGYVPIIQTNRSNLGKNFVVLEPVNRLNAKRRVQYSSDGENDYYVLPGGAKIVSVDKVFLIGVEMNPSAYAVNLTSRTVKWTQTNPVFIAPEGTDVEIWYTVEEDPEMRAQVTRMRFAETYNGTTDTRVFLYGDGTNKTIYSGVTDVGLPSAEYFPDLYEISVDSSTPITSMIKQFSYLMIFKPDGAFSTQYSPLTLPTGQVTAGFYISPVNRGIGNDAMGQVLSVYNYPRTICDGNLYDWQTVATGRDERRAKLISERVAQTVHRVDPNRLYCFDNEREQEYYLFLNDEAGTALVHRYRYDGGDVWYRYTGIPAVCGVRIDEKVYFGLSDGRICEFSEAYSADDGAPIPCRWESGSMDFGADFRRKYSTLLWVSIQPDSNARVSITAMTDKRSSYTVKYVPMGLATFSAADFRHWSFLTNRNPQIERVKLKVKKFAFYKLVLEVNDVSAVTTVLGVDMRVRYTGFVK